MSFHNFVVDVPKIGGIVGHLNSLRGDLKYSDIEVMADNLATGITTKLF